MLGIGLTEKERNIGDWKYKELGEIDDKTKIGRTKENEIETGKKEEKRRMARMMLIKNYPLEEILLY